MFDWKEDNFSLMEYKGPIKYIDILMITLEYRNGGIIKYVCQTQIQKDVLSSSCYIL